jgi:diaminohydroxyphosphoribosylaminopyrimidine deaminase / 5-amino-6-(5-phosphoribosylamino)uracil reductase
MFPVRPAPFIEAAADARYMRAALSLSRRGWGQTYPNPSVAALVVRFDGHRQWIVGRGVTAPGGRPHAERIALQQAGEQAKGATLYVTLEPCNRHSRTGFGPSCTDQIIASGISRVVMAARDPSPFADGKGVLRLRQAGIEVVTSHDGDEAERSHRGHAFRITKDRPLVQLKLAMTADGFAASNEKLAITGEEARAHVHLMRAEADAIMVGITTVLNDDPALTCRLPGLFERSPIRVVMDSQLQLPLSSALVSSATLVPLWVFAAIDAPAEREMALRRAGVEVMRVARHASGLDLGAALSLLAARGITRLMLEGGPRLANAFAAADLVDEARLWHAPHALATLTKDEGLVAMGPALKNWLTRADVEQVDTFDAGADHCTVFERHAF